MSTALPSGKGREEGPPAHPTPAKGLYMPGRAPIPAARPQLTDQVHQLLIADLAPLVALGQCHQHVQLGWVQGQLMAVHQASEGVCTNEACVLRVQLLRLGGGQQPGLERGPGPQTTGLGRSAWRGSL